MNKLNSQQRDKLKTPTQKQIALAFGVSERTIRNWKKHRGFQRLGRRAKIQDPKLTECLTNCISLLANGILSTQQAVVDYVYQETGQKINQSTISRMLKRKEVTRKKINYHYAEQLTSENQAKIKKFNEKVFFLSQSPVLALDECSFHLNEVPRYAYARKGFRANFRKPGQKGDNHTLILCIKNIAGQGVIYWELIKGGMKTKNFHEFLSALDLPTNKKHYLLLDNLSVHRATDSCKKLKLSTIRELLESKNIKPEYLPPYTPELNPVELCFNFLRQNTENRKPRTTEELKASIGKAIEILQKEDLTKWFQHCWDYFDENKVENKDNKWIKQIRLDIKKRYKKMEKICLPLEEYPLPIYPSWKWKKLGEFPTNQEFTLAYKRMARCSRKSWELANLK